VAAPLHSITEPQPTSTGPKTLTGSSHLGSALNEGVKTVFGYPGRRHHAGVRRPHRLPHLRHILVRHEQGRRAHGRRLRPRLRQGRRVRRDVGPGATNLVTGIANAMMDSIPMVAITGRCVALDRQRRLSKKSTSPASRCPITKHNSWSRRPPTSADHPQGFLHRRVGSPGPVLSTSPKTPSKRRPSTATTAPRFRMPGYSPEKHPLPAEIEPRCRPDQGSKRPIIFCGHGIIKANATPALLEFVQRRVSR